MSETPVYTLFCAPNSYAMGAHVVLEEIGVPYDLRWVTLYSDAPAPDFLAASPHARVPALRGPEGNLFESGAIAMYLAERHRDVGLDVAAGHPLRGPYLQWMHYLSATLQPDVMLQFHPEAYFPDEARQVALREASRRRLDKILRIVDGALSPGPWFLGDRLTVIDICFAMQAVWPELYRGGIEEYPNIARLVDRLRARASVREVLAIHTRAAA